MKHEDLLLKLTFAGLSGDQKTLRKLALVASRSLKKDFPEKSRIIANALSQMDIGHSPFRSLGVDQIPINSETSSDLLEVVTTYADAIPIFNSNVTRLVGRFLHEYQSAPDLIQSGLSPPTSILLTGEPGVGKTMLAEYIANKTEKQLLVLDLASSISSFLGKTGQNLRSILRFARESTSVLLLDEFDSIAKKRDDPADLGELKRIVNVLLKELESWPPNSILIAATNHPELLDKAIWRRFDHRISIPLPEKTERSLIIKNALKDECKNTGLLNFLISQTDGQSPADIVKMCEKFLRRKALGENNSEKILIEELIYTQPQKPKKAKREMIKKVHELLPELTLEKIGELFGIGVSTVHYHLKG